MYIPGFSDIYKKFLNCARTKLLYLSQKCGMAESKSMQCPLEDTRRNFHCFSFYCFLTACSSSLVLKESSGMQFFFLKKKRK